MDRQKDRPDLPLDEHTPLDDQVRLDQHVRSEWEYFRGRFEEMFGEPEVSDDSFDNFVDGTVRREIANFQNDRAFVDLEEFSVEWDNVQAEEAAALRAVIDDSSDERPIQNFLRDNPKFLVQALAGGHGRFQIAKQKLGSQFVPDFVVAEAHSFGLDWYLVEIESPKADLVRKDGRPREVIHHAIAQIQDWRTWLASNRDYARRARKENGLGMVGIDSQARGLILVGRRSEFPEKFNDFRRSAMAENRIAIHTYDWLLKWAEKNTSGRLRFEYPRRTDGAGRLTR